MEDGRGHCLPKSWPLLRVHSTIHRRTPLHNPIVFIFSPFFCPFVFYCRTSAVSSTRSKSLNLLLYSPSYEEWTPDSFYSLCTTKNPMEIN